MAAEGGGCGGKAPGPPEGVPFDRDLVIHAGSLETPRPRPAMIVSVGEGRVGIGT